MRIKITEITEDEAKALIAILQYVEQTVALRLQTYDEAMEKALAELRPFRSALLLEWVGHRAASV